ALPIFGVRQSLSMFFFVALILTRIGQYRTSCRSMPARGSALGQARQGVGTRRDEIRVTSCHPRPPNFGESLLAQSHCPRVLIKAGFGGMSALGANRTRRDGRNDVNDPNPT